MANFERDDYTRIYDHKIRSVYKCGIIALDVALHFDTLPTESTSCVVALFRVQTEQENVSVNYVGKLSGNIISSRKYLKRCLSLCLISVLQCSIHFPCPSLHSWLQRLKSAVFSVLQEDRSRGKSSAAHVNTFPMIRWVLRRMRDGGQTLLHNDMEPGFCFIRHNEARDIAISSLVPGSHEESHFLDLWLSGMMMAYSVIAKGIEELHNKRTQSAVLSSLWSEGATASCQIRLLCKTTKSPGEVTFTREYRTCGQVCQHGWHIIFV